MSVRRVLCECGKGAVCGGKGGVWEEIWEGKWSGKV